MSPDIPRKSHRLTAKFFGYVHCVLVRISRLYCRYTEHSTGGGIFPLPFGLMLKQTSWTREEEFLAMQFARSLGIPVPRPISYGFHPWVPYASGSILMEFVDGAILSDMYPELQPVDVDKLERELKSYIEIMRRCPSPWGASICSVDGGAIRSMRVPLGYIGPSCDQAAFTTSLLRASYNDPHIDFPDGYDSALAKAHSVVSSELPHKVVFTHGDLWHHNIMVGWDGRIAAIIDWETAGWYPEYWEFTSIQRFQRPEFWWTKFVRRMAEGRYDRELECERMTWLLTGSSFDR